MHTRQQQVILGSVLCALVTVFFIWSPLVARADHELRVSFLNVGQGDAIFIESPTGIQVLIDGGRDRSVLRELSTVMPWYDRSIDLVIATHPDADHITGLIDVLDRYDVGAVIESSVRGDTDLWRVLKGVIAAEGAARAVAMRGQMIDLGGGARLEILFPDRAVPQVEKNAGSIVARLVYGDTAFMFTGDSPIPIEKYVAALGGSALKSDVLKVGHHGSRTSSSREFVEAVHPKSAVISRGCDNTYGHPHKEAIELFAELHIPTFDTCTNGRTTFISDGTTVNKI